MLLLILAIGFYTYYTSTQTEIKPEQLVSKKVGDKLQQLWDDAFKSLKSNKYLRAERALLTILKFDERNAGAYNRLGILYAKQKQNDNAIECFEIAHSLEPSASTLNNLGLIYYEKGEYEAAGRVFEEAMKDEQDIPTRYIAYAKVLEKLGDEKKMVEMLERAAKLQPNLTTYNLVVDAYKKTGRDEDAKKIQDALKKVSKKIKHAPRVKQPRKVNM